MVQHLFYVDIFLAHSLTYLFIQQIFTEYLVYASNFFSQQRYTVKKKEISTFIEQEYGVGGSQGEDEIESKQEKLVKYV